MTATKTNATADWILKFIGIIIMLLICYIGFIQKNESVTNNTILTNMQRSIESLNGELSVFITKNNEAHEKIKDKIDINIAKIYEIKGNISTYFKVTDNKIESLNKEIISLKENSLKMREQ